ncbi:cyclin-dependent kinase 20 isoform X2 [Nilaparvata lugens]|uniref:cyclin-dependent kinase 20 isoform X1 n=1 Tax=Nilaparvata lugens TaxID=108931 RepID=UPI00193DBE4E|nr:cyclin-dependent kinase 20 isoform X1 [Nilaparvata lugens]XP_039283424.1 cyclin-dependent kinase 20 isoform X2 [Nilaparvata lugens]
MDNYSVEGRVGEGAHGLVLMAKHLPTGKQVALKKVLLKKIDDGIPNSVVREIKALQELDCKFVMKLLDFFPHGMGFILVFDFMPSGLWEMIHDMDNKLEEGQIKSYMQMLLKGVEYLHNHSIMHRDLKPANLLVSANGILRIADLGLSRVVWPTANRTRPYSHQVATRWYRAPELLYGARTYSYAIDLWAVGCILAELNNSSPLFPGETDIDQLAIVLRGLGTPTESIWPGLTNLPDYNKISFPPARPLPWSTLLPDSSPVLVDLAKHLLVYDADKRLTASQALEHCYLFTAPLPVPLSEMPHPPSDHRQRLKTREISSYSVDEPMSNDLKTLQLYLSD